MTLYITNPIFDDVYTGTDATESPTERNSGDFNVENKTGEGANENFSDSDSGVFARIEQMDKLLLNG